MKLYEIPNNSKIYESCSDGSEHLTYIRPDGMYSYCKTEKGNTCHLGVTTELEKHKDGFKIKQND